MGLSPRYREPREVVRSVGGAITLDVYDDDTGAQQTASSGTLTVTLGSDTVVDAQAVTAGPPASYTLPDLTSYSLQENWLEVWTLVIGGSTYIFRRTGALVRHALYPVITDTDLLEAHSDLTDLIDPAETTFVKPRTKAWTQIKKWLRRQGRRPWLVLDPSELREWHVSLTLHYLFRDWRSSFAGGGDYAALAQEYLDEAIQERDSLVLQYDEDEDGQLSEDEMRAGPGVLWLTDPKPVTPWR